MYCPPSGRPLKWTVLCPPTRSLSIYWLIHNRPLSDYLGSLLQTSPGQGFLSGILGSKYFSTFYFRAGFFDFSFVSISNVLSAWFQYEALKLVNFTTVVLFKGSRILPVMIMGRIISKTKNSAFDWITAVLLCVGSVMFMVSKDIKTDNKGYENIISGIVCLILYVVFGKFSKNLQFLSEIFTFCRKNVQI